MAARSKMCEATTKLRIRPALGQTACRGGRKPHRVVRGRLVRRGDGPRVLVSLSGSCAMRGPSTSRAAFRQLLFPGLPGRAAVFPCQLAQREQDGIALSVASGRLGLGILQFFGFVGGELPFPDDIVIALLLRP